MQIVFFSGVSKHGGVLTSSSFCLQDKWQRVFSSFMPIVVKMPSITVSSRPQDGDIYLLSIDIRRAGLVIPLKVLVVPRLSRPDLIWTWWVLLSFSCLVLTSVWEAVVLSLEGVPGGGSLFLRICLSRACLSLGLLFTPVFGSLAQCVCLPLSCWQCICLIFFFWGSSDRFHMLCLLSLPFPLFYDSIS